MTPSALRLSMGLVLLACLATAPSHAAPPSSNARNEAAERFDRGLKLFEAEDNAGALAEFRRAHELSPHVILLYNMGLVYAAMTRPVEAVDVLTQALRTPEGLSPAMKSRAQTVLAEQSARIARVRVVTRPEGARIEVDGIPVGKSPLTEPLRVSSGTHVIGAVLEEHAPARKEVTVAGNQEATLDLELLATEGSRLAHLTLKSSVPDATVRVDGQRVATTPLQASLALTAGRHSVELSRPGYATLVQTIDLGPGASGELTFTLEVDPLQVRTSGASLMLDLSEPDAVIFVDGKHIGPYKGPLKLPPGTHAIRVERDGFYPLERQLTLDATAPNRHLFKLEPTPETRADYESSVSFHRTWGWISTLSGAAVAAGGGVFLAVNAGAKKDRQADLDQAFDAGNNQVICDVASGDDPDMCNARYLAAQEAYDNTKAKDAYGFVAIGVGGALIATGVVLLLTGEPAGKYDEPASTSVGVGLSPGGASLSFSGTF